VLLEEQQDEGNALENKGDNKLASLEE